MTGVKWKHRTSQKLLMPDRANQGMNYLQQAWPQRKHKPLQSLIHTSMLPQAMVALGAANALLRAFGLYLLVVYAVPQVKQKLACNMMLSVEHTA